MKKILSSTFVMAVALFLFNGLSQLFPWGVPTTQAISTQSNSKSESFQTQGLIQLPPHTLTTDAFDQRMVRQVSTLTTDKTFSWVITKPISYYNPTAYFIGEGITQLLVAFFLSIILWKIREMTFRSRLLIVATSALMAVVAIYGQQYNWWGLPLSYTLGVAFNLVVGWTIVAAISARWIIK